MPITRGFRGRVRSDPRTQARVPPGQFVTEDFPILTAGPTQHTATENWDFSVKRKGDLLARWSWDEFLALPQTELVTDIHCVTKWTKFDTKWRGVTLDDLLVATGLQAPPTHYVMADCDGGYRTNYRLSDLLNGKAMVATHFDGIPLVSAHGGPARMLVPHLYFWKSAKWVRSISFQNADDPGFWESLGYHSRGDPWREQRYSGDE